MRQIGPILDAIYYSACALACAYLAFGGSGVEIVVAYPLFFALFSSILLQALLYGVLLLSSLRDSLSIEAWNPQKSDEYRGALLMLAVEALALWIVYSSVSPSSAVEFFAPLSLAFLAISLAQVFYHTYPHGKMALMARLARWAESAHKFGSVPGLVALAGGAVGVLLLTPAFGGGPKALKFGIAKFVLVGMGLLVIYMGFFAKKAEKAGAQGGRKALLAFFAFAAAFVAFEFCISGITHSQAVLGSFASAYALLAYISWRMAAVPQDSANF